MPTGWVAYQSGEPLRAEAQAALDALGGTTRHQMRWPVRGTILPRRNCWLGCRNSRTRLWARLTPALQPQRALTQRNTCSGCSTPRLGIRSGGHDPRGRHRPAGTEGLAGDRADPAELADLAWAKQAFEAQGGRQTSGNPEQIYKTKFTGCPMAIQQQAYWASGNCPPAATRLPRVIRRGLW